MIISAVTAIASDTAPALAVRPDRGNPAWWATLGVLCLVLLVPLTLADVPPLLDYPNHLARLFVLAFVANDPVLARFYEPHWAIIPNLALDLTVPPLLRIFPVHLVGRAVAGLILLLPVFGAVAWHRALNGRLSYWPLATVLFAYNGALLRGFLNFIASVGLALLLGATWVEWRERRPIVAAAVASAGAVVLFFCHLTGLLFFAVLVGAYELTSPRTRDFRRIVPSGQTGASPRTGPFRFAATVRRLAIALAVFAAPAALYAVSDLGQMQGAAEFRTVADKLDAAMTPVLNYFWPLDLATALLCVAVPALCLARRWCAVPRPAVWVLVSLSVLFVALPTGFKETYDLDTRFIVMLAFAAPAAIVPVALPRRAAHALGIGFLLLFAARMAFVMTVWHAWAAELVSFRTVIASVRPGDVVATIRLPRRDEPSIWTSVETARRLSDGTVADGHIEALLLIEHRAWWPYLFDNPSQQPLETRALFHRLAVLIDSSQNPVALVTSDTPETRLLTHLLIRRSSPGLSRSAAPQPDVPQGGIPATGSAGTESVGLRPVAADGDAALYAIVRHRVSEQAGPSRPPAH